MARTIELVACVCQFEGRKKPVIYHTIAMTNSSANTTNSKGSAPNSVAKVSNSIARVTN